MGYFYFSLRENRSEVSLLFNLCAHDHPSWWEVCETVFFSDRSMVFVPIMHDASSMSRYMKNWKNCNELLNDLMVLAVFDSQNIRTGENGDHLISQHNSGAYSFPGLLWPPCLTCSCGYRFSKEVKQVDRNTYKQNTLLF